MININVIGFKQFQDVLNKAPVEIKKKIGKEIRLASENFRDRAIKDAPADVGFLRSKIVVEQKGELNYEVVSGSKYSAPMEFGTKRKFQPIPGIDASEFKGLPQGGNFKDMVNSIAKWVKRKGLAGTYSVKTRRRTGNKIDQLAQDYQLAYVIARSIVRKGVTPHPFFFKQLPIARRDLFRNIRNTLKDFA